MKKTLRKLKNHFVPHEDNDHKPHFLRKKSILLIIGILIITELVFIFQITYTLPKTDLLANVLPAVLASLTNKDRLDNNAKPLIENSLLSKAAELKAIDMAQKGYFAHTTPEGYTPWYWLEKVGYKYSYAGENLAVNFFESEDVAEAWMKSPSHRANIIKKEYSEVGFGIANGIYEGRNTVFVVQFFGTPSKTDKIIPEKVISTAKTKPVNSEKITKEITLEKSQVLGESTNEITFVEKISTSPSKYLNYFYLVIIILIFGTILMIVISKANKKHPYLLGRGIALVIFAIIISFLNHQIFSNDIKISSDKGEGFTNINVENR